MRFLYRCEADPLKSILHRPDSLLAFRLPSITPLIDANARLGWQAEVHPDPWTQDHEAHQLEPLRVECCACRRAGHLLPHGFNVGCRFSKLVIF